MGKYKKELDNFIKVVNSINVEGKDEIIVSTEYQKKDKEISYIMFLTVNKEKSMLAELKGEVKDQKLFKTENIFKENIFKEKASERFLFLIKIWLSKFLIKEN